MNDALTRLLNGLLNMKFEGFTDIYFEDKKLVFHYRGGRFYVIKTIPSDNPSEGLLSVFHDTTLGKEKLDLIEVKGFKVLVNQFLQFTLVYIDNFLDLARFGIAATLEENGMLKITEQSLHEWFPAQFNAKMLKDSFTIYPL